jgi:hypothetical protein
MIFVPGSTQAVSVLHVLGLLKTIITSFPSQVTFTALPPHPIIRVIDHPRIDLVEVQEYLPVC